MKRSFFVNGHWVEEPGHHHVDDVSDNNGIAAVLNEGGVKINNLVSELHNDNEAAAPEYLPTHGHGVSAFEVNNQHVHASPAPVPAPAVPAPHAFPVPVAAHVHSHPVAPQGYGLPVAPHTHVYPPIFPLGRPRNAGKADLDYIKNIGEAFVDTSNALDSIP